MKRRTKNRHRMRSRNKGWIRRRLEEGEHRLVADVERSVRERAIQDE